MDLLLYLQAAGQVAQEAAKAVTSLPQGGDASTEIVPYFTTASLIVYAQKWLKTRQNYKHFVAMFPGADKWAHRATAAMGALWVALGLHFVYEGTAETGYAFHLITPSVVSMLHSLGDFVKVFILQQVVYDGTKDRTAVSRPSNLPKFAEPKADA